LPADCQPIVQLDHTKDKSHGDLASNIAMTLSKAAKKNPRDMAQAIIKALPPSELVEKVEIAGPGFINFFLKQDAGTVVVKTILAQKETFGCSNVGKGQKVQVEFVSANPTGPLHVGHGRGAGLATVPVPQRSVSLPIDPLLYRLRQNRRRLQQPLHLLFDSSFAGPLSEPLCGGHRG